MRVLGSLSIKKLLFDSLSELVLPADTLLNEDNASVEAPQSPKFQINRLMDQFLRKFADVSLWKVLFEGSSPDNRRHTWMFSEPSA